MSASPFGRRDELVVGFLFLTRLRLPAPADWPADAVARAAWAFPVVGLALGASGSLVALFARFLGLPIAAGALLGLAAIMMATGALHEDGLADTADGFGGGRTRERKLEIMRDSRVGSYGVLALALSLGLRAAALATLLGSGGGAVLGAMVAAHALSRAGLPAIMHAFDPARPGGLAAGAGRPEASIVQAAAALGAVAALAGLGWWPGLAAIVATAAAIAATAMLADRQIGGYTGDVLGAAQQAAETAVLLVAAAQTQ
jgi:adenosylcobinamide-GDP ribazoletransferase